MTSATVLIVDDDEDFSAAVAAVLEDAGYRVLAARDGREGVSVALRERPDLVLMDVIMDERTEGFFTIQELRRRPELAGLPIFVVSSIYSVEQAFQVAPDAAWLGHDAFIRKPIQPALLLERIAERLGAPAHQGGHAPGRVAVP